MCGICGIINFNKEDVQESSLITMMNTMKHRGPDDNGTFIKNNLGLGFVRLSIIDLSYLGHQPMTSLDNRYTIIFNGEIFNYIEIRDELINKGYKFNTNTDTEVILNAFIEWGEDSLKKFNGMWAFAIYDNIYNKMFLSRDRYGIKPFYYYIDNNQFIFASEINSILSALKKKPKASYQTILDYLIFNSIDQTDNTFFENIKKIKHGHNMSINLNQTFSISSNFIITKWYDLQQEVNKSVGFINSDEFYQLFSESICLRLRSDVPIGICLSGGLDSSSIVSVLINDYKLNNINTFSAIYKSGQYGDESEYINDFSGSLKNMFYTNPDELSLLHDLEKFIISHAEPIPATGPYAQYKVMQIANKHVTVTLDGQGADEMLAGYHDFFGYYFKDLFVNGHFKTLLKEITAYLFNHRSFYGIKVFIYFMLSEKIRFKTRVQEKKYVLKDFVKKNYSNNSISKNIYGSKSLKNALINHFEYKLEHLLKWEDINSMSFSIEARVPFLDHRLVEKTLALNSKDIINNGMTKHILRESMKGILSEKIRLRKDKIGFGTPQDEWFRSEGLKNIINEVLDSKSFRNRNLINPEIAKKMYQDHLNSKINISKEIWKWINLELWFRYFID